MATKTLKLQLNKSLYSGGGKNIMGPTCVSIVTTQATNTSASSSLTAQFYLYTIKSDGTIDKYTIKEAFPDTSTFQWNSNILLDLSTKKTRVAHAYCEKYQDASDKTPLTVSSSPTGYYCYPFDADYLSETSTKTGWEVDTSQVGTDSNFNIVEGTNSTYSYYRAAALTKSVSDGNTLTLQRYMKATSGTPYWGFKSGNTYVTSTYFGSAKMLGSDKYSQTGFSYTQWTNWAGELYNCNASVSLSSSDVNSFESSWYFFPKWIANTIIFPEKADIPAQTYSTTNTLDFELSEASNAVAGKYTYEVISATKDSTDYKSIFWMTNNHLIAGISAPAGTYTVVVAAGNTATYSGASFSKVKQTFQITINQATGYIITAPVPASLPYTKTSQQLITTAGTGTGTLEYSLDKTTWYSDYTKIVGTDVNKYTIYYRAIASDNYTMSNTSTIEAEIYKVVPTIKTAPTGGHYNYAGKAINILSTGEVEDGTLYYSFDKSKWQTTALQASSPGTYTWYYYVKGNDGFENLPDAKSPSTGVYGPITSTILPKYSVWTRNTSKPCRAIGMWVYQDGWKKVDDIWVYQDGWHKNVKETTVAAVKPRVKKSKNKQADN